MDSPSVLVGIVTRNRAAVLPNAIRSAQMQKVAGLEVAVLDDGSTDETKQLAAHYSDVHWTRWEESCGYMRARNHLMRAARGEFFVSLDDDAWFLNGDEVSIARKHLQENRSVAAVAFDILSPDHPDPRPRSGARRVAMFIGCGHMLRLAAAREAEFYETSPGLYGGEEKDLCLRLMDRGYRIDLLPGVHVWHDKTAVARHIPEQHRSGVCNDLVMTVRRTPGLFLLVAIFIKLYRHGKFSILHGLTQAYFQGVALFLRSLPEVLKSRRAVKGATLRDYMRLSRA